ncbi:MAG: alpha/beta hydrolase [Gemmataceae bacterium]
MKRLLLGFVASVAVVTPLVAQERPKLPTKPPDGTKIARDIKYVPDAGERQTLDLYLPAKSDKPVPLVIYIHGGGWEGGSKNGGTPFMYLDQGYAVASVNYRLSNLGTFPAQIQDCKEAVRWLRLHAKENNIDPERFGAFGPSAGGHLVSLLATTGDDTFSPLQEKTKSVSTKVSAVCNWFGPTDFLHWGDSQEPVGGAKGPVQKLLGGTVSERLDLAKRASPVTFVAKSAAPLLIMHGDKDPLVPLQQSEVLYKALKNAGADVTFHVVKGAGHGNGFLVPEVFTMMDEFFAKHLKK